MGETVLVSITVSCDARGHSAIPCGATAIYRGHNVEAARARSWRAGWINAVDESTRRRIYNCPSCVAAAEPGQTEGA
jgi:hypothetical protein